MGWNLPPGCTDKDIDDAAPQNEPDVEMVRCDGCEDFIPGADAEWYKVGRWHLPYCCSCAKRGIPFLVPEYEP